MNSDEAFRFAGKDGSVDIREVLSIRVEFDAPFFRVLFRNANVSNLHIISDNVLAMIRKGEIGWEKFVPHKVETAIKEHGLFDYPYKIDRQEVPSGVTS